MVTWINWGQLATLPKDAKLVCDLADVINLELFSLSQLSKLRNFERSLIYTSMQNLHQGMMLPHNRNWDTAVAVHHQARTWDLNSAL